MTVLINIYGSAGAGKSTTAIGLTHFLKLKGFKLEYVSEYAKDLVNEGSEHKLKYQLYVFAKQLKRLQVVMDKGLDYVVTDSPLVLSYFYGLKYKTIKPYFSDIIKTHVDDYKSYNLFIKRDIKYDNKLRVQTETESDEDSDNLYKLLIDLNIDVISLTSTEANKKESLEFILNNIKKSTIHHNNNTFLVDTFLKTSINNQSNIKTLIRDNYTQVSNQTVYTEYLPTLKLGRRQGNTTGVINFIKNNPELNIVVVAPNRDSYDLHGIKFYRLICDIIVGKEIDIIILDSINSFSPEEANFLLRYNLLHKVVVIG